MMSCLNAFLLKRFKRRFLVMLSSLCMAICMFVSGACTIWIREGADFLMWVPVVCLLLFVCSSMVGLLMIPWTMTVNFIKFYQTKFKNIKFSRPNFFPMKSEASVTRLVFLLPTFSCFLLFKATVRCWTY